MPEKFKGFSYEDGRIISTAYFDGYHFGDRLLEGVAFKAVITNGKISVSFANPDGTYEKGLNQKKWVKEAQEYVEENNTKKPLKHCFLIFNDSPALEGIDVALEFE